MADHSWGRTSRSSLPGRARDTRAGAAIYPRDARSAEDLLIAAGRALEAAFEVESTSAIVLAGRGQQGEAGPYRAAR